jgi:integrase
MARRVLDARLHSRGARRKLKASGKPYWCQMEPGVSIGYRKPLRGTGKWVLRLHGSGRNDYLTETFGTADDFSDADGVAILGFWQAQAKVREQMVKRAHAAAGEKGPRTVNDALDNYLEFLEDHRKSADEPRYSANAYIRPTLGKVKLDDLKTDQISKWLSGIANAAARVRTKKGKEQRFREAKPEDDPEELERRRKSTANRIFTTLKAALNRAWRKGHVTSDQAWRRVESFANVDAARVRYLSKEEITRVINAADQDFRKLARAALESGARYGELGRFLVADFNPDAGTLSVPHPKTGKARHIVLSEAGIAFFEEVTAGRKAGEHIFLKADGSRWLDDHQTMPMRETNERAKIDPPINFHGLRHTWASHAVMNGMPLLVVSKNLGHTSTKMVEKHYGHLAPSFIVDAVREHAPNFAAGENKVKKLRPRGARSARIDR